MKPVTLSESSKQLYTNVLQKYPKRDLTETERLIIRVLDVVRSKVPKSEPVYINMIKEVQALPHVLTKTLLQSVITHGGTGPHIQNLIKVYPYVGHYSEIFGDYPSDIAAMLAGMTGDDQEEATTYAESLKALIRCLYVPPKQHREHQSYTDYLLYSDYMPTQSKLRVHTASPDAALEGFHPEFGYGITIPRQDQEMLDRWLESHPITASAFHYLRLYLKDKDVDVVTYVNKYAVRVAHPINQHRYVIYPNIITQG